MLQAVIGSRKIIFHVKVVLNSALSGSVGSARHSNAVSDTIVFPTRTDELLKCRAHLIVRALAMGS